MFSHTTVWLLGSLIDEWSRYSREGRLERVTPQEGTLRTMSMCDNFLDNLRLFLLSSVVSARYDR